MLTVEQSTSRLRFEVQWRVFEHFITAWLGGFGIFASLAAANAAYKVRDRHLQV